MALALISFVVEKILIYMRIYIVGESQEKKGPFQLGQGMSGNVGEACIAQRK